MSQSKDQFKKEVFSSGEKSMPYRILYPVNFKKGNKYPVVFVLHGAGERGNDNELQLVHGSDLFLKNSATFPAIVVFPQCPLNNYWANVLKDIKNGEVTFNFQPAGEPTPPMQTLIKLINEILNKEEVDKDRVYVGGLSMGAMGTFELLRRMPGTFAAAFAICGGDNPENSIHYNKIPIRIFHGEKDDVVPVKFSVDIYNKLKDVNPEVSLTLYPEVKHDSWLNAFSEPDFLSWIFSKNKIK
ncbi:MAG: dienelactone hydrolase family protein [Cytophagaceae bacterium]